VNKVLDNGLVALALIASVGYAFASLGPRAPRRRLWAALARLAARAPRRLHLGGLARRLEGAAAKNTGACGGCESCEPEPSSGATGDGPAAEVRVSLESIGKRGQNPQAPPARGGRPLHGAGTRGAQRERDA